MLGLPKLPTQAELAEIIKNVGKINEPLEDPDAPGQLGVIMMELGYDTVAMRATGPIGMLMLHVIEVKGLRGETPDPPDPFVRAILGDAKLSRTKRMQQTYDPAFDEELRFEEVGSLEDCADEFITVEVCSGKDKKPVVLGKAIIPVGLAIDHGRKIGMDLAPQDECEPWTPFTVDELLSMQFRQLDDLQQKAIVNSVAGGLTFKEAFA